MSFKPYELKLHKLTIITNLMNIAAPYAKRNEESKVPSNWEALSESVKKEKPHQC